MENNKTNEKGVEKHEQSRTCKPWGCIYIYIYIYISRLLEKENKEIKKINIDNRITIRLKKEKI